MSTATTNDNPFAYAIAVTGPGLHRAHWLSGDTLTKTRIHAECWPTKELAESYCTGVSAINDKFTFKVREFGA